MKLTLKQLDQIPYVNELGDRIDNMRIERSEQVLASLFIKPTMHVLELGGRYGTVSCVINNIVDNSHAHVVVEPDQLVLKALEKNKLSHNSHFQTFFGIISNSETAGIIPNAYETTSILKENTFFIPVPRKSLVELRETYKIKFNCLFADCEGAFPKFLKENLDTIAQFELIIFEADGPVNYIETHSLLRGMRFKQILNWMDLHYVYINLAEIWPDGMEPLD